MTKLKPAKLAMGLQTRTAPPLRRLVGKRTLDTTQVALDLVAGGFMATGLFAIVSPRCILPNTPVASHPEAALTLGLLLSGAYWFATGENATAIAGVASTAFIYGLCKLGFDQ